MLECYLDDSGTHDGSRVLVWGALGGDKRNFEKLDAAWKAQLQNPCEGRPPIKAFHSSHLAMGVEEFEGYTQAEKDRTRWNFRKIILDCGLTFFSYGISLEAWDKVTTDHGDLGQNFTAEGFVFAGIVKNICESAKEHGEPISFQIDKKRFSPELARNIEIAIEKTEVPDHFVSYAFSPVGQLTGLQAADLVAHETYQFYVSNLGDLKVEPNIHLQRLVEGIHDFRDGLIEEEGLRKMIEKSNGRIDWSLKKVSSVKT